MSPMSPCLTSFSASAENETAGALVVNEFQVDGRLLESCRLFRMHRLADQQFAVSCIHGRVSSGSLPLYSVSPCGLQAGISNHDISGVLKLLGAIRRTIALEPGVHVDDQLLFVQILAPFRWGQRPRGLTGLHSSKGVLNWMTHPVCPKEACQEATVDMQSLVWAMCVRNILPKVCRLVPIYWESCGKLSVPQLKASILVVKKLASMHFD